MAKYFKKQTNMRVWLKWPFWEIKHLAVPFFEPNINSFGVIDLTSRDEFEKKEIRLGIFIEWESFGNTFQVFQGHFV